MIGESIWSGFIVQSLLRGAIWVVLVSTAALLARRGSAAQRALIWQAGFAGLALLPVLFLLTPPLPILRPEARAAVTAPLYVEPQHGTPIVPRDVRPVEETPGQSTTYDRHITASEQPKYSESGDQVPAFGPSAAPAKPQFPLERVAQCLLALWAIGTGWWLLRMTAGTIVVRRLHSRASPAPEWLTAELDSAAARLGSPRVRMITLKIAAARDTLAAPITWGWIQPVILLPHGYAAGHYEDIDGPSEPDNGGQDGLGGHIGPRIDAPFTLSGAHPLDLTRSQAALLHELAHIRRVDWVWLLIAQILCAFYWCVPPVWAAARCLRRETEMACDDMVLRAGADPAAYAALLLDAAKRAAGVPFATPRGVLAMARPPFAENRIRAVLKPRTHRSPASRRCVVLAALIAALCVPLIALKAVAKAPNVQHKLIPAGDTAPPRSVIGGPDEMTQRGVIGGPHAARLSTPRTAAPELARSVAASAVPDKVAKMGEPFHAQGTTETLLQSTRIHWGPPQRGLQLGIAIQDRQSQFRIGDHITADLYWRNISKRPLNIQYGHYAPYEDLMEIQTSSGGHVDVKVTYIDIPVLMTSTKLRPGDAVWACAPEMHFMTKNQFDIVPNATVTPGKYRIRATNTATPTEGHLPQFDKTSWVQPKSPWIPVAIHRADENSGRRSDGNSTRVSDAVRSALLKSAEIEAEASMNAMRRKVQEALREYHANGEQTQEQANPHEPKFELINGNSAQTQKGSLAQPNEPVLAWGPVQDGLRAGVRLESPKASYAPGEIIWQEVYLRNETAKSVTLSQNGGYEQQGRPVITSVSGASIKVLQFFGMGAMYITTKTVQAGEMALVGRFATVFNAPDPTSGPPKEVAPGISFAAENAALALSGAGTYDIRQRIYPNFEGDKTVGKTLFTGTLRVRIAGKPVRSAPGRRNEIMDIKTAPIVWGTPQFGLQLGVITLEPRTHYFSGERVRLVAILRNVSQSKIPFWHETSFAALDLPAVTFAEGISSKLTVGVEPEWSKLRDLQMTGVTYDMTFAPSAGGPSRLRQSEIAPGQAVIGYGLWGISVPRPVPPTNSLKGRLRVVQNLRVGLGSESKLDTMLRSGALDLTFSDPNAH